MRVLAALALLTFAAGAAFAQSPALFADHAKSVMSQKRPTVSVEAARSGGGFHRSSYLLEDVTWDVKKTDSMLNPVQALVKMNIVGSVSDQQSTREAAETAPFVTTTTTKAELVYVPASGGWQFAEGRLYPEVLRTWVPIEYGKCSSGQAYICKVIEQFAVKK